jgi:hypothetical protein
MAQQTINVGAAPNDGTGTPLRTAFQYTNSNFSELYTAVGPSGNNIVVPGSATITGDLTVDTSTLKVDSTNNRVGIGTATPAQSLDIASGNLQVRTGGTVFSDTFSNYGAALAINAAGSLPIRLQIAGTNAYEITSANVHQWSNVGGVAGTAMTLNSTGLGVGLVPINGNGKFQVRGGITYDSQFDITAQFSDVTTNAAKGVLIGYNNTTNNGIIAAAYGNGTEGLTFWTHNGTGWGQRMELNAAGNVGIGVTPAAAVAGNTKLQITGSNNAAVVLGTNSVNASARNWAVISNWNAFGDLVFQQSNALGGDPLASGAGTTKMTLDTSGNLLVGKTTTAATALGGVAYIGRVDCSRDTGNAATFNHTTAGNLVGNIAITSTATTYNSASDYRLKEAVQPLSGGLARVSALKPSIYKWKVDGSSGEGFLAHELADVVPLAVTGEKDAVDADGKPTYQGVDLSKVVPILVAAIQELTARVQTLEAK